jgi:hypothetical protein
MASWHVPKSVWLVIALSLSPDLRATDAQLDRLLFPEESASFYDTNARLRQVVRAARKLLGSQEAITRVLGAYILDPRFVEIDFMQFEAAANEALQSNDPERAREAAGFYHADGRLLTGHAFPGAEHPHQPDVEARLRQTFEHLADALASQTPSWTVENWQERVLGPRSGSWIGATANPGSHENRPRATTFDPSGVMTQQSPSEKPRVGSPSIRAEEVEVRTKLRNHALAWRQFFFAVPAAVYAGLMVYLLYGMDMPQMEVQKLLTECGDRMKKLHQRLTLEGGSANGQAGPRHRQLPYDLNWLGSLEAGAKCCAMSRSPFSTNEALIGLPPDRVKSPERTILFYEGRSRKFSFSHKGEIAVLMTFDGKVHVVDEESVKDYIWGEPNWITRSNG